MKKALLIAITVLAALTAAPAHASERSLNVLFNGGPQADTISIKLSLDGRSYAIDSLGPLQAADTICAHREGKDNALLCEAAAIASFEVNAGAGDDTVIVSSKVPVAVTLRGGPGDDRLFGGAAADKLIGGSGHDLLYGRGGDDWILGGPGDDNLYGGPGDDRLLGGSGLNAYFGGSGRNQIPKTGA